MADIKKLLAGRKAIEDYREAHSKLHLGRVKADGTVVQPKNVSVKHAPLLKKMLSELKALGFNSIDEFMEANKQAVEADMVRCIRYEGECDNCDGQQRGCVQSCYEERTTGMGRTTVAPDLARDGMATRSYFADYYKSLPPRKKGRITPMIPNCSIQVHIIEDPKLDWDWK